MESQAQSLVSLVVALTPVEEVLVQVVPNCKETTAGRVGRGVLAVGASDALGERGYVRSWA